MPRSSRSKSHKQSKHSREYSGGSDEDVRMKDRSSNGGKEDVKHGTNGGTSDRWNGGSSDDKENKESVKVVGESKSKSGRRHDGDEKRKSEKESGRKEKDKDRGSDRGRKGHSDKVGAEEALSKQVESQSSKRGKEITEWPIEEELRNPELEKELEKRMRRRGEASSDKDKYQDSIKETEDRRLSSRSDRSKDERHKNEEYGDVRETRQKDEKHKEDSERDKKNRDVKHRGEIEKSSKHRDDKYREDKYSEDGNKETKYKDDKYIETGDKDERSRDRKRRQDDDRDYRHKRSHDSKYRDAPEPKRLRDDNAVYDDRVSRYKDDKDRRRGNEKDESSDYRSRSVKEQRSELEKRSSAKDDSVSERGRPSSRYADVEVTTSHTRRRSSPSGSSYSTRDHHRVSKQEETKYSDYAYEDRGRYNVHSSKDYNSAPGQSDKKVTLKDDSYTGGDLPGEKRMRPESRSSPQVDKSPSSSNNEHRTIIKSDARKNLDHEESGPGPRSGGAKDTFKDGKGSREFNEAHMNNDFSQIDNDNLSVSSPYSRNSHFTEDDRSKTNNRHRRMVDQHMNRGQSQIHSQIQSQNQGNWKNVPNWPPPMAAGGYIPFQHVPPPMFHPLMQQFPPPIFGRPPMKLNPGLPYPVSDHGRPVAPPLHGWDANNPIFGDESHLYGRLDWDRRSQGWDQSGEMWKGHNAENLGQQKDEYSGHRPNDENLTGPTGQPDESEQNQLDIQPETLNLDKNGPKAQKPTGTLKNIEVDKEDNAAIITRSYLSRVDVSKDLTQPEVYDQCASMMDLDQEDFSQPVDFDCKILYLEESVEANVTDSASLFTAINDSVFQKAMFLYNKQKEELDPVNTDKDKGGSDDDGKPAEEAAAVDTVMEINKESDEPPNKPEEPMGMEVDHAVVKQEEVPESSVVEVNESLATSASGGLLPCKIDDDKNVVVGDGADSLVLSDVSTAEVAVMPTESIEFGSVNLNRIHHLSPESTH